jgi:ribosomal-protein-alanine N-acetyltransferase
MEVERPAPFVILKGPDIAKPLIEDRQYGADDSQIRIQPAGWRDLREVAALEKRCFGRDSWPWLEVLAALTFPGTVRLKAVLGDRMVGFVIGDRRGRRDLGWVASIGVHPEFRRRGLGRRLLAACERALETDRVRLSLRESNEAALQLYLRAGYSRVDLWPKYYRDGEDAIVMERLVAD